MKHYLTIVMKISSLALFGLLASSCADTSSGGGTHQMGPPGKETPMADSSMPGMAH